MTTDKVSRQRNRKYNWEDLGLNDLSPAANGVRGSRHIASRVTRSFVLEGPGVPWPHIQWKMGWFKERSSLSHLYAISLELFYTCYLALFYEGFLVFSLVMRHATDERDDTSKALVTRQAEEEDMSESYLNCRH